MVSRDFEGVDVWGLGILVDCGFMEGEEVLVYLLRLREKMDTWFCRRSCFPIQFEFNHDTIYWTSQYSNFKVISEFEIKFNRERECVRKERTGN